MSERNPGGDRGRWTAPAWLEEPEQPSDDDSPEASLFGPVTNDRYPKPHWPGETDGPGSSVFEGPTGPTAPSGPSTPGHGYPGRQAHVPPPPPPTAPQYPATVPQYPPEPYPEPTRPQPRLPDRGPPPGPSYPPEPRPGRRQRYDRPYDDRDRDRDRGRERGRGGRDRGTGGGFPLGAGFFVGAAGLACFLLALLVLPWFDAGGQDVTLADIRESFTLSATDPDTLPGADSGAEGEAAGNPADVVEDQARDVGAQIAASAIDSGRARYLEIYTETLWLVLAIGVSLAVLFSTILAPRSFALGLLLGFRRLSGFVTVLAGIVHGAALWVVFTGTGAPDPAFGVWLGLGGLGAVLLGCILGPKR